VAWRHRRHGAGRHGRHLPWHRAVIAGRAAGRTLVRSAPGVTRAAVGTATEVRRTASRGPAGRAVPRHCARSTGNWRTARLGAVSGHVRLAAEHREVVAWRPSRVRERLPLQRGRI
jgi:hypothetical protein